MQFVVSDIHNDNLKLRRLLQTISFTSEDHLTLLGDLFDRGGENADPVGVYFTVLGLGNRCTIIRGNHDQWLAEYIDFYFSLPEKKRLRCEPYQYNSFDLMQKRLPAVDMQELSARIKNCPLQAALKIGQASYLFAHAQASSPNQ